MTFMEGQTSLQIIFQLQKHAYNLNQNSTFFRRNIIHQGHCVLIFGCLMHVTPNKHFLPNYKINNE